MKLINDTTCLSDFVEENESSSKILTKYGLDFCCDGEKSLLTACKDAGINCEFILQEIITSNDENECAHNWSQESNKEVIKHILDNFHEPLRLSLVELEELFYKILQETNKEVVSVLTAIFSEFHLLASELREHMNKEEQILFPWILEGTRAKPLGPMECMRLEHRNTIEVLNVISTAIKNHQLPEGSSQSWRLLYERLELLDNELRLHIHLENNILFARIQ